MRECVCSTTRGVGLVCASGLGVILLPICGLTQLIRGTDVSCVVVLIGGCWSTCELILQPTKPATPAMASALGGHRALAAPPTALPGPSAAPLSLPPCLLHHHDKRAVGCSAASRRRAGGVACQQHEQQGAPGASRAPPPPTLLAPEQEGGQQQGQHQPHQCQPSSELSFAMLSTLVRWVRCLRGPRMRASQCLPCAWLSCTGSRVHTPCIVGLFTAILAHLLRTLATMQALPPPNTRPIHRVHPPKPTRRRWGWQAHWRSLCPRRQHTLRSPWGTWPEERTSSPTSRGMGATL